MLRLSVLFLLVFTYLPCNQLLAFTQALRNNQTDSLPRYSGVTWIPGRTLQGIIREKSEENPEAIAASFISSHLDQLHITNTNHVQYVRTINSLSDRHVIYRQVCQGVPVFNSYINICINSSNEIYAVMTNIRENINIAITHSISAEDATALVLREYDEELSCIGSANVMKFVVYSNDTIPTLCWMIEYYSGKDRIGRRASVDATSGRIQAVEVTGTHWGGGGTAKAFNPDPITKERNANLLDTSTLQSTTYIDVVLEDLEDPDVDGNYWIRGKYARSWDDRTYGPDPVSDTTHDFNYDKSQPGFQEANIYYHIDTYRRYIGDLGFDPTFGSPYPDAIKYDAHANGGSDAAYINHNVKPYIMFGDGGNASGEDQDIIVHEYTHAVQDALMTGSGFPGDQGGISEGSGDYNAVSYRNTLESPGVFQPGRVFPWNLSDEYKGPQNQPRYVYDYYEEIAYNEAHKDYSNWEAYGDYERGTIWARALMDLQKDPTYGVGRDITSSLLLKTFSLVVPTEFAPSHVHCLMKASRDHFDSKQLASIGFVFERRGFFKDRWTITPATIVHESHLLSGSQAVGATWTEMRWVEGDVTIAANNTVTVDENAFIYVGHSKKIIIESGAALKVEGNGRVVIYDMASIEVQDGGSLIIESDAAVILNGGSINCAGSGQIEIENSRALRGSGSLSSVNIFCLHGLDVRENQSLVFHNGGAFTFDCDLANQPQYIINNGNIDFLGSANPYTFGDCLDEIRNHEAGTFITEAGVTLMHLPTLISWDNAQLRSNGTEQEPSEWLFRQGAGLDDYTSLVATRTTFGGSTLSGGLAEEWEGILVGDVDSWIDLDFCIVQDIYVDPVYSGTGIHFYQSGASYQSRIKNCKILRNTGGVSKKGDGIFLQPGYMFSYVKLECSEINQDWYTGFTSVGSYPRIFDSKIMDNLVGIGISASSILTMQRNCVEGHMYEGIDVNASELLFDFQNAVGGNRIVNNTNRQLDIHNGSVVYGGWDPTGTLQYEGHNNNISSNAQAFVARVNGSNAYLEFDWFGVVPGIFDPITGLCHLTPAQVVQLFQIAASTVTYDPAHCSVILPYCSTECPEFFQNPGAASSLSKTNALPLQASSPRQLRAYARAGNFSEVYRFITTLLPRNVTAPLAKQFASLLMHIENKHVRDNPDSIVVSRSRLNSFLLARISASNQTETKAAILNVLARSLFALEDIQGANSRISQLRNLYPNSPYARDVLPILQLVAMAQRDSVKMNRTIALMQSANFSSEELRVARTMKRAYHRFRPGSPYPKNVYYNNTQGLVPTSSLLDVKNYPNPFNPTTVIEYTLPEDGHVVLRVYTILGREVAILTDEDQTAGVHSVVFDAGDYISSNVFVYVLTTPSGRATGRMVMAR